MAILHPTFKAAPSPRLTVCVYLLYSSFVFLWWALKVEWSE